MNTLSWLIYIADVAGGLKVFAFVLCALATIAVVMFTLAFAVCAGEPGIPRGSWKKPFRYIWVPVLFGLIGVVSPTAMTIYTIAASEAGEKIATNPQAQEMATDLGRLIQQKLDEALSDTGRGN